MTPEEVLARLDAPLSTRKRLGYVAVGLAGLTGSALIGVLWATEPSLPTRTRAAFAILVLIGFCWAVFGGWAVTRRVPLFARDRVVAGWLGLGAWAIFAVGASIVAVIRHSFEPSLLVIALGMVAVVNLRAARRARAALVRRRTELTHQSSR